MSTPTSQVSWRLAQLRFVLWQPLTTRRSRLRRGRQFHPRPHGGGSGFLGYTLLWPSLTALSQASLPTPMTATSTFFSLIPSLLGGVLPPAFTGASRQRCVRSALRE